MAQEARQVNVNIASSANIIIFKNPGILQLEFERRQLSKIAADAQRMLAAVGKDKNRWAYVYAPGNNFVGMMEKSLPSFWTPGLSRAYAGTSLIDEARTPERMTRQEKIKMAKEAHRQRSPLSQIARMLGVSKPTVKNYLDDYPYR